MLAIIRVFVEERPYDVAVSLTRDGDDHWIDGVIDNEVDDETMLKIEDAIDGGKYTILEVEESWIHKF